MGIDVRVPRWRRRREVVVVVVLLGEEVEHLVFEASESRFGEVGHLRRCEGGGDLRHEVGEGLVRDRVDPHSRQLLLQLRVPMVLHVVVRAARELGRNQ